MQIIYNKIARNIPVGSGSLMAAQCLRWFHFCFKALRKQRYGVKTMRCTEARYSVDVNSITETIHLSDMACRPDQYAYINPALDTGEKVYHLLSYTPKRM